MEDLLASIRKAIDSDEDDQGSSTAGESRGTLMRGALRELRVNLNDTKGRNREAREEIAELRGRILRSSQEPPPIPSPPRRAARPLLEPQRPPRNDFKTILAGRQSQSHQEQSPRIDRRAGAHRPPEPTPPVIRGRTLQDEFDDITYGAPSSATSVPEPPRYTPPYDQSYGPAYAQDPYPPQADPAPDPRGYYPPATQSPMMSQHAEAVTEAAFRHLSESLFSQGMGGRSLEDVTREMLRGMLKQWLDDNLPPLVERLVREEIARVARNGR
jgi:uncharacterized protein